MKFSEAVMLGSTQLKLDPHQWLCEDGGCLVGFGFHAAGVGELLDNFVCWQKSPWPWLEDKFLVPAIVANSTTRPLLFTNIKHQYEAHGFAIVSYLAYMVKDRNISLDEAVDWIRSVEPKETPDKEANVHLRDLQAVESA